MQSAAFTAPQKPRKPIRFPSTVALAALANLPAATDYIEARERVMMNLPKGAAFITPDDLGPILGITPNAVTRHCRQYPKLKAWRGRYKFFCDDPEHMALLSGLVSVIVKSGLKLPGALRVH